MSALRSGIEELAGADLTAVGYGELTDDVAEISRAIDMLTSQLAARVNEMDRRGAYVAGGFLNPTQWLAATTDIDPGSAKRLVAMGRTLHEFTETGRRFAEGQLSRSRVRLLCRAARDHGEAYRRDEEMLLGFSADLSVTHLNYALRHWRNVVDDTAEESARRQRERAYLHASPTISGMVRVDGLLDPERGETLLTALTAATPPRAGDDMRPAANRWAEALDEICREWLERGAPKRGGVRPQVSLVIDLEAVMGRMGKVCRLRHVGTITPETARRILCDASVSRIVTDGESVPLDLGRAVRTATPAQRQALAVRDGGCRAPGCDRPPEWCDVHHLIAWLDGGATDLANLVLLCRRHHGMVHDGLIQLE